jgi:hypothetical protein
MHCQRGDVRLVHDDPHAPVAHHALADVRHQITGGLMIQLGVEAVFVPGRDEAHPLDFHDLRDVFRLHQLDDQLGHENRHHLHLRTREVLYPSPTAWERGQG